MTRIIRISCGIILIALSLAVGWLPIVQGWLLFVAGVYLILSSTSAGRARIERFKLRHPRTTAQLQMFRDRVKQRLRAIGDRLRRLRGRKGK